MTAEAGARVISYAPVTSKFATPIVQKRANRYFALVESQYATFANPPVMAPMPSYGRRGQLVLHDSLGEHEPRVVLPRSDSEVLITVAAAWEGGDEVTRFFVSTDADLGDNPSHAMRFLFSPDAGISWKVVALPANIQISEFYREDVGGPVVRGRGAQVRLGTAEAPFIFAGTSRNSDYTLGPTSIYALRSDGSLRKLAELAAGSGAALVGSNRNGSRFIFSGATTSGAAAGMKGLRSVDLQGNVELISIPQDVDYWSEGWIAVDGSVYVESTFPGKPQTVALYRSGTRTELATQPALFTTNSHPLLFANPTANYDGAWIIRRALGSPTELLLHRPGTMLVTQWSDISGPEVEAIHAASSGQKLLIQVHRPRQMADQPLFIDPALAIWKVGDPAPSHYDELFLNEGTFKTFVSLDVDRVSTGGSFVFDSASTTTLPPPPVSAGSGGGDISQEWGVIKGSLQQRLLIPGIARLPGAYGSFWKTDVVIQNDESRKTNVAIRFAPSVGGESRESQILLEPREIRWIPDALKSLFQLDSGGGALYLNAELGSSVTATSRMYSADPLGTYGMGVGARDLATASGSRFPVTFAAAIQGVDTRTNVVLTDASDRGIDVSLRLSRSSDDAGGNGELLSGAAPGGQTQLNGLAPALQLSPWETGALTAQAKRGEAIVSVISIDNRTNDPTFFGPDITATRTRVIPIIGHLDGANGSKFRSDLFLLNSSGQPKIAVLAAKPWSTNEGEQRVSITLLPHESKVIRDALFSVFGRTGEARLRFVADATTDSSITMTSRTYTIDPVRGTYGFALPPLNNFQIVGSGESLEILGAISDPQFRTNLALVELSSSPQSVTCRVKIEVIDERGEDLDSFETAIPSAGGIQLLDLFQSRGLDTSSRPLLIRVTPASVCTVTAFATMLDNGTNDPTYLAPGLAAN